MTALYTQVETSHSAITVASTSTPVLSANSARRLLILQNVSNETLWVNVASGTAAANTGIMLGANGGNVFFDVSVPTGAVTAIATSTAKILTVTQGI